VATKTYHGSCHCGQIRYEADIDLAGGSGKCNCTYCLKTRAWKAFVQPSAFRMLTDESTATAYRKHPQASLKHHCALCGVHTHERGNADYMGGDFVGVFLTSLDDATPEELANTPVRYADGLNNNWQNPPTETRYL
jgi:hypothetical protein